jgi:dTMP kinase
MASIESHADPSKTTGGLDTEMASINDLATAAIASVGTRAADGADTEAGPMDGVAATAETPAAPPAAGGSAVARGALVILEGMDRSGKTTQVKLLEQRFVELGRKVKVMRFPGKQSSEPAHVGGKGAEDCLDRSTPIGQMIDAYLKSAVEMDDHVIHLLFSANRWEAV